MKITRTVAAVFVALIAASAVVLGVAAPAGAVTTAGTPDPINVLPSTISGSLPAATKTEVAALLVAKAAKSPAFWQAVQASAAGTATSSQMVLVRNEAGTFTAPATKAAGLSKVVNGTATALGGFTTGLAIGQTAATVFGFKDSDVCAQNNGVLTAIATWTNGVNCDAYKAMLTQAQQNSDAAPGQPGPGTVICYAAGSSACLTVTRAITNTQVSQSGTYQYICWEVSWTGTPSVVSAYFAPTPTSNNTTGGTNLIEKESCTNTGTLDNPKFPVTPAGTGKIKGPYTLQPAQPTPVPALRVQWPNSVVNGATPAPGASGNPDRTWKCVITGTSGTKYTKASAVFRETDASYPEVACPDLPASDVAAHVTIYETLGGGDGSIVYDQDTTPEYQAFRSTYPECASGTCLLDLRSAVSGVSCFQTPGPCADWFADPSKTTNYKCYYGTHAVELTQCNAYAPTFKPDAVATGNTYADPRTGQSPATQTAPSEDQAQQNAAPDKGEVREPCWPTGWGVVNPLNWVLQPVKCALNWAFVPRQSAIQGFENRITQKWTGSAPGKIAVSLAAFTTAFGSLNDGGCGGLLVDLTPLNGISGGFLHLQATHYLAACQGDFFHDWAPPVKVFIVAAFTIAGVIAVKGLLGRFFGFGS